MKDALHRIPRAGLLVLLLFSAAACKRDDEVAQRTRLATWFALGETLEFSASRSCAAGLYRVVDGRVRSAMSLVGSPQEMQRTLEAHGRAVLMREGLAPDMMMVAMANFDRPVGMAMRLAGLEARPCMGTMTQSAFRHVLETPGAALGWDSEQGAIMLMEPHSGLLVVAMGSG